MEEIRITLHDGVVDYLNDLIFTLFQEEYFGFELSAQQYVQKIYDFIEFDLIKFPRKISPENLKFLGEQYACYKANNRTRWYIFFEQETDFILITYITNNHSKIAQFLR